MDGTLAGLLHDCAGDPDDLAPRLILADWLEDHGQAERAAFVRLRCQIAGHIPDHVERRRVSDEADALLAQHRAAWLGTLDGACSNFDFSTGLCRVLVTGKQLFARGFAATLNAHAETALIEQLRVVRCAKPERLATSSALDLIPGLSLARSKLTDDQLADILESKHLERLSALDLSNTALTDTGAAALARSELLARLARLELRNTQIGPAGLRQILAATQDGPLRELDTTGATRTPALLPDLVRWRAARPANSRRVMNSLGMEFVLIPAGSFLMGSTAEEMDDEERDNEGPRHPVTITRPFWLGRFAVTQAEYEAIVGDNPAAHSGLGSLPVESVNFAEVQRFCKQLSKLDAEKAAKRSYRLPTEAEWEFACRAGTFTAFHMGDRPTTDFVNYDGGHVYEDMDHGEYVQSPAPVGSYPPNAFGLYEMHGNVWEWTNDRYANHYESAAPATDPTGPRGGNRRSLRGGCWDAVCSYCRAAHRYGEEAGDRDSYTGFRVVLVQK